MNANESGEKEEKQIIEEEEEEETPEEIMNKKNLKNQIIREIQDCNSEINSHRRYLCYTHILLILFVVIIFVFRFGLKIYNYQKFFEK